MVVLGAHGACASARVALVCDTCLPPLCTKRLFRGALILTCFVQQWTQCISQGMVSSEERSRSAGVEELCRDWGGRQILASLSLSSTLNCWWNPLHFTRDNYAANGYNKFVSVLSLPGHKIEVE